MKLTRRFVLSSALALSAAPAFAQESEAPDLAPDMWIGAEDAPVTMVEYASFTCPHCRNFHMENWANLKTDYIDTGKVKFVSREVYFDQYGLWAAMLARCGGPSRYFGITDMLYKSQPDWSREKEAVVAADKLRKIGLVAGLDGAAIDQCFSDEPTALALIEAYQKNTQADDVTGTPTIFINGERSDARSWDQLKAALDAALDV